MAQHNLLGRRGEDEAAYYLIERDVHILERNWRCDSGEIDIIAEDYGLIIFIEVKTRTADQLTAPEDAVDAYRMRRLSKAADEYRHKHNLLGYPFRFDIIAITENIDGFYIRHIPDAFHFVKQKPRFGKF